ncbi:MAG: gliding motility-associated C-terminal domain-containing protein, partial [Nitrospira sp.]|nr:gliding motility-associated C-terminal domain-containing protein [Nitrospira sp.]
NFITPNGDGMNDSWHMDPARDGFRTAELIVFDRFGQQVFHGDPAAKDFRGENDAGEPLSEGVYFYVLRLFKVDSSMIEREGYLHVNR